MFYRLGPASLPVEASGQFVGNLVFVGINRHTGLGVHASIDLSINIAKKQIDPHSNCPPSLGHQKPPGPTCE